MGLITYDQKAPTGGDGSGGTDTGGSDGSDGTNNDGTNNDGSSGSGWMISAQDAALLVGLLAIATVGFAMWRN